MVDSEQSPSMPSRREALIKAGKVAVGAGISAVVGSIPPVVQAGEKQTGTDLEVKKTEFNRVMTEMAEKLGWTVKTTHTEGKYGGNRCLSFNQSIDWEGCITTFNGFQTPERAEGFKPAGYLVYVWGEYKSNDDSGQRLLVFPKEVERLPLNSGDHADGSLFDTLEQQGEVAKKFNFVFPESQNKPLPRGAMGPIGYWALSKEELDKIGNIYVDLP